MSMLLDNDILARFTQTNVIVGLVLLVVGILLAIISGRITKLVRKTDKIQSNELTFLLWFGTIKPVRARQTACLPHKGQSKAVALGATAFF